MKPLNAGNRRKAFFTYLLVFLLSLVPIFLSIYLYGKVDQAENTFLREKYEEKQNMKVLNYSDQQEYDRLKNAVGNLKIQLTKSRTKAIGNNESGEIDASNIYIEQAIDELLKRKDGLNETEALLLNLLQEQKGFVEVLSGIYSSTYTLLDSEKKKAEMMEKEVERLRGQGCL